MPRADSYSHMTEPHVDIMRFRTHGTVTASSTTAVWLRAPNKMIVVPSESVSVSGKKGEAGHPRMVDGA